MNWAIWGALNSLAPLQEHRKTFQAMWLGFLKHKVGLGVGPLGCRLWGRLPYADCPCLPQLPLSLYKKVLVTMHDTILPHLAQPTLMIDFLTSACDVGEWALPGWGTSSSGG